MTSVLDLCRTVRSQWQVLTRMVWPEDAEQLTRAEIDRLAGELTRRWARLLARRRRIERLRDRLAGQRRRLEVDPGAAALQAAVGRAAGRLAAHEEAYARRRMAFDRRKKLYRALASGQVVVCPEPADDGPS